MKYSTVYVTLNVCSKGKDGMHVFTFEMIYGSLKIYKYEEHEVGKSLY
jgi:hypothetical protein